MFHKIRNPTKAEQGPSSLQTEPFIDASPERPRSTRLPGQTGNFRGLKSCPSNGCGSQGRISEGEGGSGGVVGFWIENTDNTGCVGAGGRPLPNTSSHY